MIVRMLRGAVVGPEGRTAAPGEKVEVSEGLGGMLVFSGKAVEVEGTEAPPPETPPAEEVTDRELEAGHRDPAPKRGKK